MYIKKSCFLSIPGSPDHPKGTQITNRLSCELTFTSNLARSQQDGAHFHWKPLKATVKCAQATCPFSQSAQHHGQAQKYTLAFPLTRRGPLWVTLPSCEMDRFSEELAVVDSDLCRRFILFLLCATTTRPWMESTWLSNALPPCNLEMLFSQFIFIYLKDRDTQIFPSAGLLPKCPPQSGLDQAKPRQEPGINPVLPRGWQEPKHLSHHLPPPREQESGKGHRVRT